MPDLRREVTAQYHPRALRWFLVNTQYRQPINYTQRALEEVSAAAGAAVEVPPGLRGACCRAFPYTFQPASQPAYWPSPARPWGGGPRWCDTPAQKRSSKSCGKCQRSLLVACRRGMGCHTHRVAPFLCA